jgi:ATP-dependent helicase HrpA
VKEPTAGRDPDLDELSAQLEQCMLVEQHRLRRRLHGLKRSPARRRGSGADTRRLAEEIATSIDLRRRRESDRPRRYSYPPDLPVAARRQEIADAIAAHQVVVVCGETGSGKTTQLPKICLELGRGGAAMIGHTQPRRIAARSVATRIAGELGSPLGRHVGYKVRFTDRTGPGCLLKIMTDGILLAETQRDRSLHQYDTIIIDEAHERSLNIDFMLGYLRRLQPKRPDLKIIITSATIDPRRFSAHFGQAPVVEVSGRTYPVEVRYEPLAGDDADARDAVGSTPSWRPWTRWPRWDGAMSWSSWPASARSARRPRRCASTTRRRPRSCPSTRGSRLPSRTGSFSSIRAVASCWRPTWRRPR